MKKWQKKQEDQKKKEAKIQEKYKIEKEKNKETKPESVQPGVFLSGNHNRVNH